MHSEQWRNSQNVHFLAQCYLDILGLNPIPWNFFTAESPMFAPLREIVKSSISYYLKQDSWPLSLGSLLFKNREIFFLRTTITYIYIAYFTSTPWWYINTYIQWDMEIKLKNVNCNATYIYGQIIISPQSFYLTPGNLVSFLRNEVLTFNEK